MAEPLIVPLAGEIDMANAAAARERVLAAGLGDASALIVDLSAVTYFDSTGMRMLDEIAGACAAAALPLRVVAPESSPARLVLRICAWPAAQLAESAEDALSALGA